MPKSIADSLASAAAATGATIKSLVKTALAPGGRRIEPCASPSRPLIVMANGPSLKDNIAHDMPVLCRSDTLAVNFAANAPEFFTIRPRYYVLADPHFFRNLADPNVAALFGNLCRADWPITLFVPRGAVLPVQLSSSSIRVRRFPFHAFESTPALERIAFNRQWGMPRPRNVLIPSLMIALWLGYRTIYIVGADHTWTRTLSVSDDNLVVSIQPHFYSDNRHEQQRVATTYSTVHIHEILQSFSIAFRSYHAIERYARSIGATILNSTPGSFIDAFRRAPLPGTEFPTSNPVSSEHNC